MTHRAGRRPGRCPPCWVSCTCVASPRLCMCSGFIMEQGGSGYLICCKGVNGRHWVHGLGYRTRRVAADLATVTNRAEPSSSSKTLWMRPLPYVRSPIRAALQKERTSLKRKIELCGWPQAVCRHQHLALGLHWAEGSCLSGFLGNFEHLIDGAIEGAPVVVLEGAGQDLRGGGGVLVDQHRQRQPRRRPLPILQHHPLRFRV